jgi:hypothetical protein
MMHIVVGLFMVALGVWGVMDEWYYAVDCIKAVGSLALLTGGLLGLAGGVFGHRRSRGKSVPVAAPDGAEEDQQEMGAVDHGRQSRSGERAKS